MGTEQLLGRSPGSLKHSLAPRSLKAHQTGRRLGRRLLPGKHTVLVSRRRVTASAAEVSSANRWMGSGARCEMIDVAGLFSVSFICRRDRHGPPTVPTMLGRSREMFKASSSVVKRCFTPCLGLTLRGKEAA